MSRAESLQLSARLTYLLTTLVLLAACGGGGGSDGSQPASPAPLTVTIAPLSLSITADAGVSSSPASAISLTLNRDPGRDVTAEVTYTDNGIETMALVESSVTIASLNIRFKDPSILGAGTYTDQIQIQVCLDQSCTQQVSGSPRTVSVTYTVTGTPPPGPTITANPTAVNVQATTFGQAPTAKVSLRIDNVSTSSLSVGVTNTGNGLGSASYVALGASSGDINLFFKAPTALGPGVFNDIVTVTATCSTCTRPVSGVPLTINVQYTVSNTVAGPNGYTVKVIDVAAADIVWSSVHDRLYFSNRGFQTNNPDRISVLNPYTGVIETSSLVGNDTDPGTLAITDSGQFLYVALGHSNAIRRMTLPGLAQDILIPLGSDPTAGAFYANDLEVQPGQNSTIAVARKIGNGTAGGVVIFDNAVPRASIVGGPAQPPIVNWLEWRAGTSTLYGSNSQDSSFSLSTMSVGATGVQFVSQTSLGSAYNYRDIHHDSGIVYADSGEAYDTAQGLILGRYKDPDIDWTRATLPASDKGRVFTLGTGINGARLTAFDLNTFARISSIDLTRLNLTAGQRVDLVRWGTNGLAMITDDGKIVLVNGVFVGN